jgi:hypothetical protein
MHKLAVQNSSFQYIKTGSLFFVLLKESPGWIPCKKFVVKAKIGVGFD